MSIQNISSIRTRGQNCSYSFSETSSLRGNNQSEIFDGRLSKSTIVFSSSLDCNSNINYRNYQTVDRPMQLNSSDSASWIERCKQTIKNLLKQISKPITKQGNGFFLLKIVFLFSSVRRTHNYVKNLPFFYII